MKQQKQRHCGVLTSVARGHGNKARQDDRDGDDDADEDDDYDGAGGKDVDGDVDHEDDDEFKGAYHRPMSLWQVDDVR